jgi:hypothetical protein
MNPESRAGSSFRFRTVPPPDATSFHFIWLGGDTPAFVAAWQEWAPAGPDELAASLFVEAAGERGRPPVVYVFGTMVDTRSPHDGVAPRRRRPGGRRPRFRLAGAPGLPRDETVPGRARPGRRSPGRSPLQQVRVLPPAASGGGRRRPDRQPVVRPPAGPVARARLQPLGRRLQPRAPGSHGLRPRPSPTATSSFFSSTQSWSTATRRPPTGRRPAAGSGDPRHRCTRGAREACTRTFRTWTSRTSHLLTTGGTTTACCG